MDTNIHKNNGRDSSFRNYLNAYFVLIKIRKYVTKKQNYIRRDYLLLSLYQTKLNMKFNKKVIIKTKLTSIASWKLHSGTISDRNS